MKPIMLLRKVRATTLPELQPAGGLDGYEMSSYLAGYILEKPSGLAPQGKFRSWGCLLIATGTLLGPLAGTAAPFEPRLDEGAGTMIPLQPAIHLAPPAVRTLRPLRSSRAYRISSPPARGLVTPELAGVLETVFERFARQRGFTQQKPLEIHLSRGFKAGSPGHGEGRAADIDRVGGQPLRTWKQEWDRAMSAAEKLSGPQRDAAIAAEQQRNLGYGLYKTLQAYSGWRVNKAGWRPYLGVMQLFGPWKAMQIKDPGPEQEQRLRDQQWVFRAHRDHIHVAR